MRTLQNAPLQIDRKLIQFDAIDRLRREKKAQFDEAPGTLFSIRL